MPTIQANGRTWGYIQSGSGDDVVLLHGFLMDKHLWDAQIVALAQDYRVTSIDLAGHGESGETPEGYDFDRQAADIVAVLDALGIARFHLAGMSMGGFTGVRLAAAHPDRVRSLVMVGSMCLANHAEKKAGYEMMYEALTAGMRDVVIPKVIDLLFAPDAPADLKRKEADRAATIPEVGLVRMARAVIDVPDVRDRAATIRIPVLFAHGAEDQAISVTEAEESAAAVPNARVAVIPGAGHTLNLEAPEELSRLLREHFSAA